MAHGVRRAGRSILKMVEQVYTFSHMQLAVRLIVLVAFSAATLSHTSGQAPDARPQAPAVVTGPPASSVQQPAGWDEALAMHQPTDRDPDPQTIEIDLEARVVDLELKPGVKTTVWTYNGQLPGPYIRAAVGDRLIVHFTNSLPEPTTIHWHGLRVPNEMDGSPGMTQPPIPTGGTFHYEFVLKDAGTYCYHPHVNSSG